MSGGMQSGGVSEELLTTKGDTHGYSTENARVGIGADTQVLTADSTQALGLKWAAPSGGMSIGTEQSTTPVGDTSETQVTAGQRWYNFFNVGTAGQLILITGIEWKNGTNASGSVSCGVDKVNSIPPTESGTELVAYAPPLSGGSTGTIERQSEISSLLLHGGETYGAWVQPDDTLREFRRLISTNFNRIKNMSGGVNPPNIEDTAWTTSTANHYCVVYYRIIS